MAQYTEDIPLKPTAAVNKYTAVILGTAADQTCSPPGGANASCIGVVQETVTTADVTAGRVADVRVLGRSTVVANGSISRGALVVCGASGGKVQAAAAAAKQWVLGVALTAAGADGDWIEVELSGAGSQVDNS